MMLFSYSMSLCHHLPEVSVFITLYKMVAIYLPFQYQMAYKAEDAVCHCVVKMTLCMLGAYAL